MSPLLGTGSNVTLLLLLLLPGKPSALRLRNPEAVSRRSASAGCPDEAGSGKYAANAPCSGDHIACTAFSRANFRKQVSSSSAGTKTKWYSWEKRLDFKFGGEQDEAKRQTQVWTAMRDKWWMMFIDGGYHSVGEKAFDFSQISQSAGDDGKFSEHMFEEYKRWSEPEYWRQNPRWTAEMLGEQNSRMRGREGECGNMTRFTEDTFPCIRLYIPRPKRSNGISGVNYTGEHVVDKHHAVIRVLEEYYENIEPLLDLHRRGLPFAEEETEGAFSGNEEKSPLPLLARAVPHLAKLYVSLADLHPFRDGNGRTRNMVLQTELVRFGGHPAMLWGNGGCAYAFRDMEEVTTAILEAFCSWERAFLTNESPYVKDSTSWTGLAAYDDRSGSCWATQK